MRNLLLFIISWFVLPITGFGQDSTAIVQPYQDKMPAYPEGTEEMYKYIFYNLHYPALAKIKKISGQVITQFTIDTEGEVRDIKVTGSLGYGCDEEAVRVIELMGKEHPWIPGIHNGHPVPVKMTLPLRFVLQ